MKSIHSLNITTLAENLVQAGGLGQWGLSFLLEVEDLNESPRKILFDTGANREAFFHNVKLLEIDLSDIDSIVLSHGHSDHTSATVDVVKKTGGVKVYGHPHTFLDRYVERKGKKERVGPKKGEGLSDIESNGGEVIQSVKPVEVVPGIWTTGQVERLNSFEKISPPTFRRGRRIIIIEDEEHDDLILDDQSLFTSVQSSGVWVIAGCAHSGPVNTLQQVQRLSEVEKISSYVGGTHLVYRSDAYLENTFLELQKFSLDLISPCHCTGFKATTRFLEAFKNQFVLNFCLRVIEAGKPIEKRII